MSTRVSIWWLRRDLRLEDNRALSAANSFGDIVVPLFILDPALVDSDWSGDKRLAFLFASLGQLDRELQQRGSRLIVRSGPPIEVLTSLVRDAGVDRIYAEADVSPYSRSRDDHIKQNLPLYLVGQPTVTHPDDVLKDDSTPYTVFTPYARRWKEVVSEQPTLFDTVGSIETPLIESDEIPSQLKLPDSVPFAPGPRAAAHQLHVFTSGEDAPIYVYGENRDRLDLDGTSRLSPYLRFGMISARQTVAAAMDAVENAPDQRTTDNATKWLDELIWREFYAAVLHNFPQVRMRSFRPEYRDLVWDDDPEDIAAWTRGETGYPIIDAAMRQLHTEGWMHNRARMIVASFLVKDLLVNWQIGERHFMQHLIDGDPASNNGGWQWSAGTGTDAAPYFRIFNPVRQSKQHDPDGTFIRQWLPELQNVSDRFIHDPWTMPESAQSESSCIIGRDYPEPVVDHSFARQRALDRYKRR
jgi:deoxyribodipyrimidine photo-lyase